MTTGVVDRRSESASDDDVPLVTGVEPVEGVPSAGQVGPRSSAPNAGFDAWAALLDSARDSAVPETVDGVPVGCQVQYRTTHGPPYIRKSLACPLRGRDGHGMCRKQRNCNQHPSTVRGQMEAVGYLAVWAKAAHRFATGAEHVAFKPPEAEVQQWVEELLARTGVHTGASSSA